MQQAIIDAFIEHPTAVFGIPQLVAIAFPNVKPEPKHHVAVLRAARRLAENWADFDTHPGRPGIGGRLLVHATNTRSLGIGRVYAHFKGGKSVAECEAILDDPTSEAHLDAKAGGLFDLLARRNLLWAYGKDDEVEVLTALIRERVEKSTGDRDARHPDPHEAHA